jgi:hypothetical protein
VDRPKNPKPQNPKTPLKSKFVYIMSAFQFFKPM